jgi:hypothetical protein
MKASTVVAGFAGGVAEILWVLAYSAVGPVSATAVAREVTASVLPDAATSAAAPLLGVGIHLALSIAIAFAFVATLGNFLSRDKNAARYVAIAVAALTGVWAVNFLLLLPLVNGQFVTLMPYAATLFSKALFGAAMGAVLVRYSGTLSRSRVPPRGARATSKLPPR